MTLPLEALTGTQRRHLRKLAHGLKPIVFVGEAGVSDAVIAALDRALADHELVKVKLPGGEAKRSLAQGLARRSGAHLGGLVGHMVILYRPDPEEPRIALPGG
ncbi:MAG: ribosome assembly RNA-binding protein YhbY [Deltaproteobacteria bacterium]|nr:ribosome assembly RNA-binding protein YhbY [Deltaproteobacteria bacterium]MBW2295889.1 ribosome assembly RNA-binding protein YhbY [Deltaproteobacteria bacterium]MBW2723386.1 ribosome assembly RNA-binding protein YhbY [Deltaproteobacteria bacterium]